MWFYLCLSCMVFITLPHSVIWYLSLVLEIVFPLLWLLTYTLSSFLLRFKLCFLALFTVFRIFLFCIFYPFCFLLLPGYFIFCVSTFQSFILSSAVPQLLLNPYIELLTSIIAFFDAKICIWFFFFNLKFSSHKKLSTLPMFGNSKSWIICISVFILCFSLNTDSICLLFLINCGHVKFSRWPWSNQGVSCLRLGYSFHKVLFVLYLCF